MAQKTMRRSNRVDSWLQGHVDTSSPPETSAQKMQAIEQLSFDHQDSIPLGDQTENRFLAGQTYNEACGGQMSQTDRDIIAADCKWADAPQLPHITCGINVHHQPPSSQAAIDKFESMCRDNDSVLSRSATWGTRRRRRSHPSVLDLDADRVASGSFLKKLTIGRNGGERNTLRRPRSKSEIPKASTAAINAADGHPNLVEMWRKSRGPPVAPMAKTCNTNAAEDDDDDDDFDQDRDLDSTPIVVTGITPDLAAFQQHVVRLNPGLDEKHGYLVDRIAFQQMASYKQLLSAKVKHLGLGTSCPSGPVCPSLGGSAIALDPRGGHGLGADAPSTATPKNDSDKGNQVEGFISPESFLPDIPMPPTQSLPAEFECQLCYQRKRFQKPSDWTKHVHEDVQPFTCTWGKCRDQVKVFKRKADWVRHENEGHRHLEWWTCDVDDCWHTCYRRDNFLQHLVREHKFPEPRVKTKAAMKRAGGVDPTWSRVAQCHVETPSRPQDEPCRFCGKVLPTWKKLTVHLAKHMEQISLPVLRLVAAKSKELAADTIISPVLDHQPRPLMIFPDQTAGAGAGQDSDTPQHQHQQLGYAGQGAFMYPVVPSDQSQQLHTTPFYAPPFHGNGQCMPQPVMSVGKMNRAFNQACPSVLDPLIRLGSVSMGGQEVVPFPHLHSLGLQNVADSPLGLQAG